MLYFFFVNHHNQDRFDWEKNEKITTIQKQQVDPVVIDHEHKNSFILTFSSPSLLEEPVADILWMKEVAKEVLARGHSYFNLKNQQTNKNYFKDIESELSTIRGEIIFTNDATAADYDAKEILALSVEEDMDY